jgi:hypothetical protein
MMAAMGSAKGNLRLTYSSNLLQYEFQGKFKDSLKFHEIQRAYWRGSRANLSLHLEVAHHSLCTMAMTKEVKLYDACGVYAT